MSARQPDLFYGDRFPPKTARPERAYLRPVKPSAKAFAWESMGAWVRHIHRLFALERASQDHYNRFEATARQLTVARIRECRHDDDLARVEAMLIEWRNAGGFHGLDRVFCKAERGELLVEVRNRRQLLAMGRSEPKPKGPRLDPARLPLDALERLIQTHPDMELVDRLRAERARR